MAFKPFSYVQADIPRQLTLDEYRRQRPRATQARRFSAVSVREVRRHGQARPATD